MFSKHCFFFKIEIKKMKTLFFQDYITYNLVEQSKYALLNIKLKVPSPYVYIIPTLLNHRSVSPKPQFGDGLTQQDSGTLCSSGHACILYQSVWLSTPQHWSCQNEQQNDAKLKSELIRRECWRIIITVHGTSLHARPSSPLKKDL